MDSETMNRLSKEDRKHVELLYQLKRNEALLATILHQINQASGNTAQNTTNSLSFFNEYIEKYKADMEAVINNLTK